MICPEYANALLRAVDFTLDSLGKSSKRIFYHCLETTFYIRRSEIPERMEEFDDVLKSIFNSRAILVERLIFEALHENLEAIGCLVSRVSGKKSLLLIRNAEVKKD